MANNRQQQCTTVVPPNRRVLLHAPLLCLLVASGPCLAAEGDAKPRDAEVAEYLRVMYGRELLDRLDFEQHLIGNNDVESLAT